MHRTQRLVFGSLLALSMLGPNPLHGQTTVPVAGNSSEHQSAQSPTLEDWTSLPIAKSGLSLGSIGAVALGKVDVGDCTRERLRVQWRVNDPIDLFLIRPHGMQKLPAVLFLYNYTSDEAIFEQEHWCNVAVSNGFAVVGVPSALSWSRIRPPRPLKDWFVSELQEALAVSTHDVQMVLNSLATRNDIDTQQVAIFGEGSGGAVAILAASADPRIRVLDLMNPWGDWPDWLKGSLQIPEAERANYLKPEFLARVSTLDPVSYLPQLKDLAIQIQQVLADPVTPQPARDKIAAAVSEPGTVTRYASVADEAKALGSQGIVGWIATKLHSSPSPVSAK
jgi:pimeloyl-ACP methyl ester carboxylesterase